MCDLELEMKVAEGSRIFRKYCNSLFNVKVLVGAFNQEKALVGAFSVIVQPVVEPMDRFTALVITSITTHQRPDPEHDAGLPEEGHGVLSRGPRLGAPEGSSSWLHGPCH